MALTNYPVPTSPVQAQPLFLVDSSGNVLNNANGLPITFAAGTSVTINDPTTTTQKMAVDSSGNASVRVQNGANVLAVDSSGRLSILSITNALPAGTNLLGTVELADSGGTNKLAIDSSGRLTLVPNQVVEIGDGTTPTQKLAIDASGRLSILSIANALPAGTNVIGHVVVDSAGSVSVTSLPALPAGTNVIGHVIVDSAGSVSVTALPALPAGTNVIGSAMIQAVSGTALSADQSNTELRISAYGKNSTAGDTPLLVDISGHLLPDVIDRWARQVGQVDIARYNGSAVGTTNPQISQDQIRGLILAGKGFTAITKQTTGVNGNEGLALYNPSSNNKTVVIYSIRTFANNNAAVHEVHLTTSDPAFGNAVTPVNNNAGNGTTSGCTASYASSSQTISGTLIAFSAQNTNATQELLSNGDVIVLPSGANNGVAVYIVQNATGGWGVEIGYVEY